MVLQMGYQLKRLINLYCLPYKGLSKKIWFLMVPIFINSLGDMIPLFLALYLKNKNVSIAIIGVIISCYGAGGILGGYLGGYLSDKMNSYLVAIFSLFINAVLLIFLTVAAKQFYLLLIIFFLGLFNSAFRPAIMLLLTQLVDNKERTKVFGLRRVFINLGVSVGAVLGGLLATVNFKLVFIYNAVLCVVASLFLFKNLVNFTFSIAHDEKRYISQNKEVSLLTHDLGKKYYWIMCLIMLLNVFIFVQLNATYPLYLKSHYGMNPYQFSLIFTLNTIMIVLIEVPLLNFLKKYNQHAVIATGSLMLCVGMALLPISKLISFAFILCVIWTVGEILFFPTSLNMAISATPENQGRYMGIYQMIFSVGYFVGPMIGAFIYPYEEAKFLWAMCGFIGILSVFGILFQNKVYKAAKNIVMDV